jgi:hypothetical protein
MVAYLLSEHRTTVNEHLKGLAKDRVERLVHLNRGHIAADPKRHDMLQPLHGVFLLHSSFQQQRSIRIGFA